MINERLFSVLPKMYFPNNIFIGQRNLSIIKSLDPTKTHFVVSQGFENHNEELRKTITTSSSISFHDGEPVEADIEIVQKKCEEIQAEFIVALGGGSVIDLVKAVKMKTGIQMIAIPTTIGSGAEVSQFSVFIDPINHKKNIMASRELLPEIVIINPQLYTSLSKEQVVFQSIDSLSHALESLVSRMSNYLSDQFALSAIENLYSNLQELANGTSDATLLEKLKIDSTMAGLSQSSAATGLTHSFAHQIGVLQKIPHAKAISIFLLDVIELNMKNTDKYNKLNSLKHLSCATIVPKLRVLFDKLGVKTKKLEDITDKDMTAEAIRKDICTMSNPFAPKKEDIISILDKHI